MHYFLPSAWLKETSRKEDFESDAPKDLNTTLRNFYGEVRNQEGKEYNHNSMRSIRSGINRHLQSHPHERAIDIIKDKDFNSANNIFDGYLKKCKAEGLDATEHKATLTDKDWKTLHDSKVLSTATPTTLQNKVLTNLLTHFGRRGSEGLRQMKKNTFVLKTDENGKKYFETGYNELTKNYQNSSGKAKDISKGKAVMVEQPGDPTCPVTSFIQYLDHLDPNCNTLFTYPFDHVNYTKRKTWKGQKIWYSTDPLGKNTLASKMKNITTEAGLSKTYTNHCMRSTVITRLSRMGVEARKIINVTGHKHPGSVEHYCAEPSIDEKADLSNKLHDKGPAAKKLKIQQVSADPPAAPAAAMGALVNSEPGQEDQESGQQGVAMKIEASAMYQANVTQLGNATSQPGNFANIFTGAVFNNATINFNFGNK